MAKDEAGPKPHLVLVSSLEPHQIKRERRLVPQDEYAHLLKAALEVSYIQSFVLKRLVKDSASKKGYHDRLRSVRSELAQLKIRAHAVGDQLIAEQSESGGNLHFSWELDEFIESILDVEKLISNILPFLK